MSWHRYGIGQTKSVFRPFSFVATLTIIISMASLTYFNSRQLQASMLETAAEEGAILIDVFLGPSLQELAASPTMSPTSEAILDKLLKTSMGARIKAINIWLRDGTLAYATDKQLVGQKYPSSARVSAFAGNAFGEFVNSKGIDKTTGQTLERELIEIYAPIYKTGTREIIAVGEVYNSGTRIATELRTMQWTSVLIVGSVTAPMMIILFIFMSRASRIIAAQRITLQQRVDEAQTLALQNTLLRRASEAVQLEAMHSNERLLGQIGQDMHDGPVQLVSVLALKLSELGELLNARAGDLFDNVKDLTSNVLKDLRNISIGLVLPELDGLTCAETLHLAIEHHQRMTGTRINHDIAPISLSPTPTLRVCIFRVVQECLSNAFAHGDGREQHVVASESASSITIVVSNTITEGHEDRPSPRSGTGLGLLGLQRRVIPLGGSFSSHRSERKMMVTVHLPKRPLQNDAA